MIHILDTQRAKFILKVSRVKSVHSKCTNELAKLKFDH